MNILLAALDIFESTGGGETFFARLIKSNKQNHYHYFTSGGGSPNASGPRNASAIGINRVYRSQIHNIDFSALSNYIDLSKEGDRIADIIDMAAAVRGRSFDIVEIPDYLVHGWLLMPFLHHFGVTWKKTVLSMHGTISDALRDNWPGEAVGDLRCLEETESLLYRSCDIRYGIGKSYIEAWSKTEGLNACLLDAKYVIDLEGMSRGREFKRNDDGHPPDLAFVGRQDKWKGPDLFLELCSLMPRKSYSYIHFYGSPAHVFEFISTRELARIGEFRGVTYQSNRPVPHQLLMQSFSRQRLVTVLPSRRDTFNLTALEAILNGCPTAISSRCGACVYLDNALPELPYLKFDINDLHATALEMTALLADYDGQRERLRSALESVEPRSFGMPISEIYEMESSCDENAVHISNLTARNIIHQLAPMVGLQSNNAKSDLNAVFKEVVQRTGYQMGVEIFETALSMSNRLSNSRLILGLAVEKGRLVLSEETLNKSETVLTDLQPHSGAANRSQLYRLMSEIEGMRGNSAIKAAYLARTLRLTDRADPDDLDELVQLLDQVGLPEESKVAHMIFARHDEELYEYLKRRPVGTSLEPEAGIAERHDFRYLDAPRVSVIVSVYNGESKMERFMAMLQGQSETARDVMEVIFVDSSSTDDTQNVLLGLLSGQSGSRQVSALYVRSERRETIQKAWNRGIAEARGDIVTFLGNDEGMRPDTLDIFIDILDRDPTIDWIQGNAIVTAVDEAGTYVQDIFPHRREFDSQHIHYLDCCYIGFAGAAYRRELHEKYGLYDAAFRSAGDNEFKNRILPFINVHCVPETLGIFLNYPETRTTESPIAELEDIRAWYAFRTLPGIRFSFEGQSDAECINQFYRALKYSRPYSTESSTDVEFALAMAAYIRRYRKHAYPAIEARVASVQMILDGYRGIDEVNTDWPNPSHWQIEDGLIRIKGALNLVAEGSELLNRRHHNIPFWYRNDNRAQQHYFPWPSTQRRFAPGPPLSYADVAGAQDLAELITASKPEFGFADFSRAWKDNDVHQILRLCKETQFDILLPICTNDAMPKLVRDVSRAIPSRGTSRMTLIAVGVLPAELISELPANIYLTGQVEKLRPFFASANLVGLPGFDKQLGRRYLNHAVSAAWFGRAMVLGTGVANAIVELLPEFDIALFSIAHNGIDLAQQLVALNSSAELKEKARAANQALLAALEIAAMAPTRRVSASEVLWSDNVREIGRLVHACFEGQSDAPDLIAQMEVRLADASYKSILDSILDSLLVAKNAAMLDTKQSLFALLASLPAAATLMGAYARLYLFGYRKSLAAAGDITAQISLNQYRNWPVTPLGAWRKGASSISSVQSAAPSKMGALIVLGTPGFWSSPEGQGLMPSLAVLRERVGERLYLTEVGGSPDRPGGVVDIDHPTMKAALVSSAIVAVVAPKTEFVAPQASTFFMWVRALSSRARLIGTRQALWFAGESSSPALFDTAEDVVDRLGAIVNDPAFDDTDLIQERQRFLDLLGVSLFK